MSATTLLLASDLGALIGLALGARYARRLPAMRLRQMFAVFVVALAMVLLALNMPAALHASGQIAPSDMRIGDRSKIRWKQRRVKRMAETRATYGFGTVLDVPMEEAIEQVTTVLNAEGFGVLTTIDVKQTM